MPQTINKVRNWKPGSNYNIPTKILEQIYGNGPQNHKLLYDPMKKLYEEKNMYT